MNKYMRYKLLAPSPSKMRNLFPSTKRFFETVLEAAGEDDRTTYDRLELLAIAEIVLESVGSDACAKTFLNNSIRLLKQNKLIKTEAI